jgi:proteasome lid subunit RPN8/RPN11
MIFPDWLIQDIRIIGQMPNVSNLKHSCINSHAEVCFDLFYDEYAQTCDERLINPEPIKLRYKIADLPSEPEFLSDRLEFPRNLPHLNPVREEDSVSICLWRKGGNSALYLQRGIVACLDVLKEWLEDASVDHLQYDGWEPTPRGGFVSLVINLGLWQEFVTNSKLANKIISFPSKVILDRLPSGDYLGGVVAFPTEYKELVSNNKILRNFKDSQLSNIRTYLLIPDIDFIENEHNPLTLNSWDRLLAYSESSPLKRIVSYLQSGKKPKGMSIAVLAIGQRRPISLIKDIPSLSNDEDACKVEITAILILHDSKGFHFHPLQVKSPANSEMLASVSGTDILDKNVSVLGCGSIGGAISDYLVRSGHTKFSLWDSDLFEAHNNARHVMHQTAGERAYSALEFKVLKMSKRIREINPDANVQTYTQKFDAHQISRLQPGTHVIDATGEAIEPSWLCGLEVPYTRIFIADKGKLAFLLTQVPNGVVDMLDIEAELFFLSHTNDLIKDWLLQDSQLSDKMLGLSCSSATMEMPWFSINNHVSALMPSLLKQIKSASSCVVMNVLNDEGSPKGIVKFNVEQPEFQFERAEIEDTEGNSWAISFNQTVREKIHQIRDGYLPAEAAGYLLGLYNINSRRISIILATQGQFTSSSSAATLSSIEQDSEAQDVLISCNNMLKPLGTWHSHPGLSAQPSNRDQKTFQELVDCKERTIPTVMMICADSEIHFSVGLNRTI